MGSAHYLDPLFFVRSLRAEQVLEETNEYVLKARNAPVPVQVQEVLRGNLDGEKLTIIMEHLLQHCHVFFRHQYEDT